MKNPVIVYNSSYNGLSIIQELGARGIPCIAMGYKYSVGAFSKYCKFKRCPNPLTNESEFVDFLYQYCASLPLKPVLFPTNDEWALVTAKHKTYLEEVAYPCVANFETTNTFLSKDLFYEIGQQRNYLTPSYWPAEEMKEVERSVYPIVAKAKYKSVPARIDAGSINNELRKNRLVVLNNKEELERYLYENKSLLPHLVFQEYVRGVSDNMYTVGVYCDRQSKIKALFTGRKVRGYPADIGDNILGESHAVPDYVIQNTKKIIKDFAYTGIAEFEYKKDTLTEEFKLIEINPRPWSWIGITPYCGANIPFVAYQSMLGINVEPQVSNTKAGEVKYVKVYQDFFNCLLRYRFNYKPWHMSYAKWRRSLKAKKLVVAENHKRDWPILFASVPFLLAELFTQKI